MSPVLPFDVCDTGESDIDTENNAFTHFFSLEAMCLMFFTDSVTFLSHSIAEHAWRHPTELGNDIV